MGRKRLYETEEERKIAQRASCRAYYQKNKELLDKKALERYYNIKKYGYFKQR